jgi:trimethylamine--corrinoid protein Co-methyltransferase
LAGANLIYGLGMLESGMTFDFGQLVLDDEIAGMVKRVVGGIPVDDETLAVDVIAEVGAFKDFLSLDHTMRHMREHSQPRVIDRRVREDWATAGSTDAYTRATEKARELLETHAPLPVGEDAREQMRGIIRETEQELGVTSSLV